MSLCDSCGIDAVIVAYCRVNSLIYDLMGYIMFMLHTAQETVNSAKVSFSWNNRAMNLPVLK